MRFNIFLKDNDKFVLASCPTLEFAKKYLKEMYETDKELAKYYNWDKMPEYKIVKVKEV